MFTKSITSFDYNRWLQMNNKINKKYESLQTEYLEYSIINSEKQLISIRFYKYILYLK